MAVSTLLNSRRLAPAIRLRLEVLFAKAFEALAETYRVQAAAFVRRLQGRLQLEEALDRYFHEVGVPYAMVETVRARALLALAPHTQPADAAQADAATAWSALRPEGWLEALRRRAQAVEEIGLDCRMAASVSDEAIAATHVAMALETIDLLSGDVSPDEAIMLYVRRFSLPSLEAQIIFRRALAAWAGHPSAATVSAPALPALTTGSAAPPRIMFGARPALTLHVIG